MKKLCLFLIGCGVLHAADYVELRDGRRLEGRILRESPEEIHIQVAANPEGTIRQVFMISAREIRTWNAERPVGSGDESQEEPEGGASLTGLVRAERLIREAESMISAKRYDAGIDLFQEAADVAAEPFTGQTPVQRVEGLESRAHALRLLAAALDGKLNHLRTLERGSESDIRAERQRLEREWSMLQDDIRRDRDRRRTDRRTELGSRHLPSELEDREKELREEITLLNQREVQSGEFQRNLQEERVKTEAMIRLTREQVTQATAVAREARRELSRRR